MYQASEQFSTAISGNGRTLRAKITLGDQEITEGILSIRQYSQSNSDSYISIGDAVSAYVEVEMWKPPSALLENAEVQVSIGMGISGAIEWVPLGLYTVQKPKNDDGVVTFTAYDRIQSKMSGAYFSELDYPADGKLVLQEISEKTGVPIDTSNLPDGVMIPQRAVVTESGVDEDGNETENTTYADPFEGYTYREALGYIAQFYGKFATVNRAGTVELRWYTETDYVVNTNRYYDDLVTNDLVFSVESITCQTGSELLRSGTGVDSIQLENPIMTQERLEAVYELVKELQFLPASFSFLGDMRLDLGDVIRICDKAGNRIRVPVMYLMQDFDGGLLTQVKSFGRTEQEASAPKGPTAQKIDRMYTELFLVEELVGSKASFDYVHAIDADFQTMRADFGEFQSLVAGDFTATNATIENLTAEFGAFQEVVAEEMAVAQGWMLEGSIGSAQISDLDVNKLNAGTIDTSRIRLYSPDSALELYGSQILVNDTTDPLNPINRVIVGKYTNAEGSLEYGLLVRSADGQTVMIDGEGVHHAGITDGAVSNNNVADDANIDGNKLDIHSVVTCINEGNTTISGTVIQVGNKTLDVTLSEQQQEIGEHSETLTDHESRITANEQAILLKVDAQTYTEDQEQISQALEQQSASIELLQDSITERVENVEIHVESLQQEMDGIHSSYFHIKYSDDGKTFTGNVLANLTAADWENGHYDSSSGDKTAWSNRIRMCELVQIEPDTKYLCNTGHPDILLVLRAYDADQKFIHSIGSVENGQTVTTWTSEHYLGISLYSKDSAFAISMDKYQELVDAGLCPDICKTEGMGDAVGEWIGTLVDENETASTVFTDYTWKKFTGSLEDELENLRTEMEHAFTQSVQTAEAMIWEAVSEYTRTSDFETFQQTVSAQLQLLSDQMTLRFSQVTEQLVEENNALQSQINSITKLFTFSVDGFTIGDPDSPYRQVLDNGWWSFEVNGEEKMWMDAETGELHTPETHIDDRLVLFHNYVLSPDADGNVNCIYVEEQKLSSSVTASTSSATAGSGVILTAKADGGRGRYTYRFLLYNTSTAAYTTLQDYSTRKTYRWTALSAGTYRFYVDEKDGSGTVVRSRYVEVTTTGGEVSS